MKTKTTYTAFFLHILGLTVVLAATASAQPIWITRNASVSFYSYAPIEDIKASSTAGEAAINPTTRSVYCKVPIRSFRFRKKLMEEHFNEKYLESDRYPYAEFSGRIVEDIDLQQAGNYDVTVQGRLTIHNVVRNYTARATLETTQSTIHATAGFKVKLADHHIRIPTLLVQRIAEIVEVSIEAVFAKSTTSMRTGIPHSSSIPHNAGILFHAAGLPNDVSIPNTVSRPNDGEKESAQPIVSTQDYSR